MWGDIKDARLLYLKGFLFLLTGLLAGAGLLIDEGGFSLRRAALLLIALWAWCRWYYFLFYVIEKYADPGFKFAGVGSFLRYLWIKKRNAKAPSSGG